MADGNKHFVYAHENDQTGTPLYESDAYPALGVSAVAAIDPVDSTLLGVLNNYATYNGRFLYTFYSDFDPDKASGNTGLWRFVLVDGGLESDPCANPTPPASPPANPSAPPIPPGMAPSPSPNPPPSPPPMPPLPSPMPPPPTPSPPPFPPPIPECIPTTHISHTGVKECAVAVAVHRNATSTGIVMSGGHETAASSTDTFGFGYGRTTALLVRYDTRVRIHASYGCSIRVGYEEATLTGGGFFHGGVALNPEPDCGPGSYIDIIPEDWRLLASGKKRLRFDHTCGIIPTCGDPPSSPSNPSPTTPPPSTPPTPPSPPPFPPGTVVPPGPPRMASPTLPPGTIPHTVEFGPSTSTILLGFGLVSLCGLASMHLFFMAWMKKSVEATRQALLVPVARIGNDGSTSVVTGVAVGRRNKLDFGERQSLLAPRF